MKRIVLLLVLFALGLTAQKPKRVNKAIASFVRLGWITQHDRRYRITDREQLEGTDRLNYDLLDSMLEDTVTARRFHDDYLAISQLNGRDLDGRRITVEMSNPQAARPGGGGRRRCCVGRGSGGAGERGQPSGPASGCAARRPGGPSCRSDSNATRSSATWLP